VYAIPLTEWITSAATASKQFLNRRPNRWSTTAANTTILTLPAASASTLAVEVKSVESSSSPVFKHKHPRHLPTIATATAAGTAAATDGPTKRLKTASTASTTALPATSAGTSTISSIPLSRTARSIDSSDSGSILIDQSVGTNNRLFTISCTSAGFVAVLLSSGRLYRYDIARAEWITSTIVIPSASPIVKIDCRITAVLALSADQLSATFRNKMVRSPLPVSSHAAASSTSLPPVPVALVLIGCSDGRVFSCDVTASSSGSQSSSSAAASALTALPIQPQLPTAPIHRLDLYSAV
jgi:hypothetical protein